MKFKNGEKHLQLRLPSGTLIYSNGISSFSIGTACSKGPFFIDMLVYSGVATNLFFLILGARVCSPISFACILRKPLRFWGLKMLPSGTLM